jgi:hypothetical protein
MADGGKVGAFGRDDGLGLSNGGDLVASPPAGQLPPFRAFTILRLNPEMVPTYRDNWTKFMRMMRRNAQRFKSSPSWRKNMGFQ